MKKIIRLWLFIIVNIISLIQNIQCQDQNQILLFDQIFKENLLYSVHAQYSKPQLLHVFEIVWCLKSRRDNTEVYFILESLIINICVFKQLLGIIRLLESKKGMQGTMENKTRCGTLFSEFIAKISRLRKRLTSCGYSVREVMDIIFSQFLRLPQIDWKNLQETNNFYQAKASYKVDAASTQIILRLQKIVPNLQTFEVCEYLLTVLELNASDLGFNLQQSSSDSNDSCSGMQKLMVEKAKKATKQKKNVSKKQDDHSKRKKDKLKIDKNCKKIHYDQRYYKNKKAQEEVDIFFRNRPRQALLPLQQEQLEKQMKKIPESEDSDH